MTRRAPIVEELRCIVLGIAAALLPRPENLRLARSWEVDVAPYSFAVGIGEAVGGGLGFFFGAIASLSGSVPMFNMLLLENWFEGLNTTHFSGGGLIGLFLWCCNPLAWVLVVLGATGAVRIFAYVGSREPVGEPVVWGVLRFAQWLRRIWLRRSLVQRLGPLRADRLVWGKGADLTILCCRPREEWLETPAIELEERFFAPTGVEERHEGAFDLLAYHFRELEPNEVIRSKIAYVDTAVEHARRER